MTAQIIGLVVLALTIGLVVAALELNHRRPHPPATRHDDADTRRLISDLGHARDREWRRDHLAASTRERHRAELVQFELQSLRQ